MRDTSVSRLEASGEPMSAPRPGRMPKWTEQDIPGQRGRTVLVTGASSGIGLRSAQVLASRGARVLMTSRSPERGERALRTIASVSGTAELVLLDLADLTSVRAAAERVRELSSGGLDLLMNNAGMTALGNQRSPDGFELQFATNYLGPAALTWLLMPLLGMRPRARVVTMSASFAKNGTIDLADPNFEHRAYKTMAAYNQAKLAALIFAIDLDRRLKAAGRDVASAAAHPGWTATGVFAKNAARSMSAPAAAAIRAGAELADRIFGQSVAMGALPMLYAATAPEATGGQYYGPSGPGGLRGYPQPIPVPGSALRPAVPQALWELTARLTGVTPDPG